MLAWYLLLLLVVSPISFLLYGWDKRMARLGNTAGKSNDHRVRRIPERTLHSIDAVGGWPGGLCGQQFFRHKTRKTEFQIRFWMTVVIHVGTVAFLTLN